MLIFIVLIVIVLIMVALVVVKGGQLTATKQGNEVIFVARPDLFSAAERSFYGVLEQALGEEYRIFGKVRLGDLVEPARGLTKSQSTTARNRLNQKHVDFVLCRPDTLAVVAVIELDDATHGRKDRSERDDFVDKALTSAHLPVVHVPARKAYALPEVQDALAAVLKTADVVTKAPAPKADTEFALPTPPQNVKAVSSDSERIPSSAPEVATPPNCPACNVPMVKRQAKQGANAGKWFWACTGYPKCRKVLAV
ncbi:MAG: DUF2726 domain-containing protein [Desulfuromonadales bacterium]|nr:DUF2726 domain-containing protein [Desulfuromonadales bacterium]